MRHLGRSSDPFLGDVIGRSAPTIKGERPYTSAGRCSRALRSGILLPVCISAIVRLEVHEDLGEINGQTKTRLIQRISHWVRVTLG